MKPLFLLLFIVLAFKAEAVPRGVDGGSDPGMLPPTGNVNLLGSRIGAGLTHPWSYRSADHMREAGTTSPPSTLLTGLVSYWMFDESTGNAIDAAGGGNTGTPASVTQNVSGKVNTAYSFDGSSSNVNMGNPSNLSLTGSGSVSAWVYLPSLAMGHDGAIVEKGNWSNDVNGYNMMYLNSNSTFGGELANASTDQSFNFSGVTATANTWIHLVVTWDGTNIITYMNGGNAHSVAETVVPVSNVSNFGIGASLINGAHHFHGTIDEVGVWNRALTSAEVAGLYNSGSGIQYPFGSSTPSADAGTDQTLSAGATSATLTGSGSDVGGTITNYAWSKVAGGSATITSPSSATTTVTGLTAGTYTFELKVTDNNSDTAKDSVNVTVAAGSSSLVTGIVSYWTLDESTGNAIDAAGGGNTGTPASVTQNVSGKVNTAYSFDGSSSNVNMGNPSNLSLTGSGSVSAWVYLPSLAMGHDGAIVEKGNWSNDVNGYNMMYLNSNSTFGGELANASTDQSFNFSGVTATANTWIHLVVTWDGTNIITYMNGGNAHSVAETVVPVSNVSNFGIGASLINGAHHFHGTIDEVGVWNRALTSAEVAGLYNSGSGIQYPFGSSTPSADAGTDQTLSAGATSATLTGSGSDVGGTITNYAWSKVAGGSATITSPSSATTTVTGLTAGTYTFELKVTDNNSDTAKDSVNVTVAAGSSSLVTGIVSYWTLDESTGNAIDAAGGGNTGTPASVTQNVSGKVNTAYSFDGSSSNVNMGNPSNLSLTGSGSVSAWVYLPDLAMGHDGLIAGKGDWSNDKNGYLIVYSNNDNTFVGELANASSVQSFAFSGVTATANTWIHLVVTWDGTNIITYMNGGNAHSVAETVVPVSNVSNFGIGASLINGAHHFHGTIDEVGVWNRALTSAEVAGLYNSGSGIQYPFGGSFAPTTITASVNPVILTTGNTTTLTATGSGTCTWTKYYDATLPTSATGSWPTSTPPVDGSTLTPSGTNNSICTITDMKQGTWYYQVTNSNGTARIAISVDALPTPANSSLIFKVDYPTTADGKSGNYGINNRSMDTTIYYNSANTYNDRNSFTTGSDDGYTFRDLQQLEWVDNMRGKIYYSGRDGYGAHNGNGTFSCQQLATGYSASILNTGTTYIYEWRGYLDQDWPSFGSTSSSVQIGMEIHPNNSHNGAGGTAFMHLSYARSSDGNGYLLFGSSGCCSSNDLDGLPNGYGSGTTWTSSAPGNVDLPPYYYSTSSGHDWYASTGTNVGSGIIDTNHVLMRTDTLVNKAHTFRYTVREGEGGSGAFEKLEVDGVQKYLRATGKVGQTLGYDYPIWGEIYDNDAQITQPNNMTRHRQVSVVMEKYNIFQMTGNNPPIVNAGPDQNLSSGTTSTTLDGSYTRDDGGYISSLTWSKISGPSCSITSTGSYTTGVTGMTDGTYVFQLLATDNNGDTSSGTVHVEVGSSGAQSYSPLNTSITRKAASNQNTSITWKVAPNPVSSNVGFVVIISSEVTSSEKSSLVIWDVNGRELFRQSNYINPGQTLVPINTSKMPAGGYIIALFDKSNKRIGKSKTVILR